MQTTDDSPDPIERLEFETETLMAQHPPVLRDENKRVVFGIAFPPGSVHGGRLAYTRWPAMVLPDVAEPEKAAALLVARDGYFDYEPTLTGGAAVEWHVNFADRHLFVAYRGSLFAQDEMQVAEHPALGALREALLARGRRAVTVEGDQPTPVLVMGVQRRCRVATEPNGDAGRPGGLYGNAFGRADPDAVARATMRLEPPTITNLLAMAAPSGGFGRYRADMIREILVTAFTGFRAAVAESRRAGGPDVRVAVHTGYWGCGAFGGNRALMALLRALAAEMAGLDRLVLHLGNESGRVPMAAALRRLRDDLAVGAPVPTGELVETIAAMGFEWGTSDGN